MKRHDGQGINAKISLHNPPRRGVNKFIINRHWCSANINYLVHDCEADKDSCVIDSKDAKSIVHADVAPDHGTFSSQGKHIGFQAPGSLNYKENMEHMANVVIEIIMLYMSRPPCLLTLHTFF